MDGRIRLDKWLWQARLFKSRSLSAAFIEAGNVRLNGAHAAKPAQPVGPGDVLTFALHGRVRVLHVLACGTRRGPAPEAQGLYREDGAAPVPPSAPGGE
ncbi:MAG: RNA-binding S4 domain-containing protein [Paracoccaceae bacterium]